MEWYIKCWKNYAVFQGRARRKEFWMFALFNFVICMALSMIGSLFIDSIGMASQIPYYIYALAAFIPNLAVLVRRLHDVNKSGWWYFIILVPLIGIIWMLVLLCTEGDKGDNKYGPNPKALEA
ncbi:MAG: DUF805 domain-containing protein [Paludibacteraceae bacterium]|nr:DUF805 domain-containing protein [Paludibacteraceae bacterium]